MSGRFADQEARLRAELDQWVMRSRAAIAETGEQPTVLALARHFADRVGYSWPPTEPMPTKDALGLLTLLGAAVRELITREEALPQ